MKLIGHFFMISVIHTQILSSRLLEISLIFGLSLTFNSSVIAAGEQQTASHENTQSQVYILPNHRYEELKNKIFAQAYTQLPQYKVKKSLFGPEKKVEENHLLGAALRTFESSDDLIELTTEHKLLNANGICFAGTWKITQDNEYSGLYQKGANVPAIVRASVALSGTKQKNKRGFGMAIKLLPADLGDQPSLNAFVLNSMGGTITKHVLDLEMDNEPPLGRLPRFSDLSTALRLRRDLEKADKEYGAEKPDSSFRPVSIFADYNTTEQDVIAPRWLRLSAMDNERMDEDDFRDELNVKSYSTKKIPYRIEVAGDSNDDVSKKKNAQWLAIGVLELTQSITSASCDLNLHFQHPKLKQ